MVSDLEQQSVPRVAERDAGHLLAGLRRHRARVRGRGPALRGGPARSAGRRARGAESATAVVTDDERARPKLLRSCAAGDAASASARRLLRWRTGAGTRRRRTSRMRNSLMTGFVWTAHPDGAGARRLGRVRVRLDSARVEEPPLEPYLSAFRPRPRAPEGAGSRRSTAPRLSRRSRFRFDLELSRAASQPLYAEDAASAGDWLGVPVSPSSICSRRGDGFRGSRVT